jgi:hypothetical protein
MMYNIPWYQINSPGNDLNKYVIKSSFWSTALKRSHFENFKQLIFKQMTYSEKTFLRLTEGSNKNVKLKLFTKKE